MQKKKNKLSQLWLRFFFFCLDQDVALDSDVVRDNIAEHMAECHLSVDDASDEYLELERRYNYTTPTSFLGKKKNGFAKKKKKRLFFFFLDPFFFFFLNFLFCKNKKTQNYFQFNLSDGLQVVYNCERFGILIALYKGSPRALYLVYWTSVCLCVTL